jgi:hypothetical protein
MTRMEQGILDEVGRIARFKGVSSAQVMRWAVDEYVGAHSVELSNVMRPTANSQGTAVLELSNSGEDQKSDADYANAWSAEYDRPGQSR